jgi:cytochrome d ubiquinol oxidase subunit I
MDVLTLSRIQFAITTIYHFFFVPLTIGLSLMVAFMETKYVRTGDETYKRMAKFWGKLFLINFAIGVVTGIVQEFQFGMNWSEYSRFVGDIFGAPLAIEALLAFFLESTFIGLWIFGWDRVSKKIHLASIWLVAIGGIISAFFILVANSFMQQPGNVLIENGRAVMTDFGALIFNPAVWYQFPHVLFSGLTTAAFFVLGISGYHLLRKRDVDLFQRSFKMAAILGVISVVMVAGIGHIQGQHIFQLQPMKLAATEAVWETESPSASLSIIAFIDEAGQKNTFSIDIPGMLSFLTYNSFQGEVKGIKELQAQYTAQYLDKYGADANYIPPVTITFWAFRIMIGIGLLMLLLTLLYIFFILRKRPIPTLLLKLTPFALFLPYIANSSGWMLTEMGRQPWMVYGLLRIDEGVSPIDPGLVLASLISFAVVYGVLMVVDIYLLARFAKAGPAAEGKDGPTAEELS